jgi:hypothetical protein
LHVGGGNTVVVEGRGRERDEKKERERKGEEVFIL